MARLFLILILALWGSAPAADNDLDTSLSAQRKAFLAAEKALREGNTQSFRQLLRQLQDYPLLPYLEYQQLRRRLGRADAEEVQNFLRRHSASPLADRLQQAWIRSLARHGRWDDLIAAYRPSRNVTLQCLYRRALYKTGAREAALEGLEQLWLVGHSQPRACDPLFAAWRDRGAITPELAWRRFALAMTNNKLRLARYLRRFLPEPDRRWADLWIRIHRRPELVATAPQLARPHPMRHDILLHGIKRLAREDPRRAVRMWEEKLKPAHDFSAGEIAAMERRLAIALAVRGDPEALARLAAADEQGSRDNTLQEWRVRAALHQRNWHAVLAWIYQLDEATQQEEGWLYWQARALDALQQKRQAESLYLALAGRRSYYGFLAADRLALPYRVTSRPTSRESQDMTILEHHPGILRARELFALARIVDARREWYYATRDMAEWQLRSAARLAHTWGWHDRAIVTMARTRHRDDLVLRFPLAHRERVLALASANDIEPAFAFAVIRQESAFTPDARSPAGALGLMQLLPRTARQVASSLGMRLSHRLELLDVDTNLRLGMAHLGRMLRRYDHHPVLAAAAYNAGAYRVNKWIRDDHVTPADIWLETLPIAETRGYVRNVLLFTAIYQHRLGQQPRPLLQSMRPIAPPGMMLAKTGP